MKQRGGRAARCYVTRGAANEECSGVDNRPGVSARTTASGTTAGAWLAQLIGVRAVCARNSCGTQNQLQGAQHCQQAVPDGAAASASARHSSNTINQRALGRQAQPRPPVAPSYATHNHNARPLACWLAGSNARQCVQTHSQRRCTHNTQPHTVVHVACAPAQHTHKYRRPAVRPHTTRSAARRNASSTWLLRGRVVHMPGVQKHTRAQAPPCIPHTQTARRCRGMRPKQHATLACAHARTLTYCTAARSNSLV